MGRVARGVRGIRLRPGDHVIGMDIVEEGSDIFVISKYGYGKRTKVAQFYASRPRRCGYPFRCRERQDR